MESTPTLHKKIAFFINDTATVTAGIGFKLQEFHPESYTAVSSDALDAISLRYS